MIDEIDEEKYDLKKKSDKRKLMIGKLEYS